MKKILTNKQLAMRRGVVDKLLEALGGDDANVAIEQTALDNLPALLEQAGLVTMAKDGEQALDVFGHEEPGIVITDLKMPKMDGLQVLSSIRKANPLTQVILITGQGDDDVANRALCGGALAYLKKPVDLDELCLALERARENLSAHRDASPNR